MRVVLFCGGMGMRLREYSESIPKPMVNIGQRPILWQLMKYYSHFGHKDFILCLGWKGRAIKDYFLSYDECISNNFVLRTGGQIDLLGSDIHDWTITFVDTGQAANVGERLLAVEHYLEGEEVFLANYSDGLTDLHLPDLIDDFHRRRSVATFLGVRPRQSFHVVETADDGLVTNLTPIRESGIWMNAGFFALRSDIFRYMKEGEDLVLEPFRRLMAERKLNIFRYEGFWGCMDTYKEKQLLDDMYMSGERPWEVWNRSPPPAAAMKGGRPVSEGQRGKWRDRRAFG